MKGSARDEAQNADPAGTSVPRSAVGTLFVVATPIGNLEDITLRALRVLREVALVAAEDTRRTGNLLRHYQITTPLVSLHEHNEHGRIRRVLQRLEAGESVAIVSDAGTPGISDPGAKVVHAARHGGFRVEPIPGASAVVTALSASGLEFDRFVFAGFPPVRSKDRILWFEWVAAQDETPVVCFEAPHRIQRTLKELERYLVERQIIVARELTKMHEQWVTGAAGDVRQAVEGQRGEFVFIISPASLDAESTELPSDTYIANLFGQITESGVESKREAVRRTAQQLALPQRHVYQALERTKTAVE